MRIVWCRGEARSSWEICRVATASAGEGEENDEADEGQDGDDEEAAFGASGTAAEDGFAYGVRGEEMVLDHGAAVGYAVEEGLCPVP